VQSPKIALLVALRLLELLVRNLSPESQNRRFNLPLLGTKYTRSPPADRSAFRPTQPSTSGVAPRPGRRAWVRSAPRSAVRCSTGTPIWTRSSSQAGGVIRGIDLGAITDPQFNADIDYAAKQYAARAVGELHQELMGRAEKAREASSFSDISALKSLRDSSCRGLAAAAASRDAACWLPSSFTMSSTLKSVCFLAWRSGISVPGGRMAEIVPRLTWVRASLAQH
jgi:hypothetical protein